MIETMGERTDPPSPETLLAHAGFLRALACALLGDAQQAEDVVQEAFLAGLERPPSRADNLRGWLSAVVRNLARMRRRTEGRRTRRERIATGGSDAVAPPAWRTAARLEAQRHVVEAVSALPEPYRTVVVMHFYDGMSAAAIARRLSVPAATVRTRLRRALNRLRSMLDGKHDGERRVWSAALLPLVGVSTARSWPVAALTLAALLAAAGTAILAMSANPPPPRAAARAAPAAPLPDGGAPVAGAHAPAPARRGVVRDRATLQPVGGACVYAEPDDARSMGSEASVRTDAQGRFALGSGAGTLCVIAAGYLPWTGLQTDVLLERGGFVEGRVLDPEGRPVPGARVWCHLPRNRCAWPAREDLLPVADDLAGGATLSDPHGCFRIDGLRDEVYELRATKAGYAFGSTVNEEPPLVRPGDRDRTIRLWPTSRIEMRAVDEETRMVVSTAQLMLGTGNLTRRGLRRTSDLVTGEALEVADGLSGGVARASFAWSGAGDPGVEPTVTLWAQAPGYLPARAEARVVAGATTSLVAELRRDSGTRLVPVRLSAGFADGTPFEGTLRLSLRGGLALVRFVRGEAERALPLPEGHVTLEPQVEGWAGFFWTPSGPRVAFDVPGPGPFRILLVGNPVRLDVRDAKGRAVRGYDLAVVRRVEPPFREAEGDEGHARQSTMRRWDIARHQNAGAGPDLYLPPGPCRVTAALPGLGEAVAEVMADGRGGLLAITLELTDS